MIVSTLVLRLKAAESFLESSQCTYFTEKSGLRDAKRSDFIRSWRRTGLKNPDKPKIFIKKNVRNHSYHQFWLRSGLTQSGLTEVYCTYKELQSSNHTGDPLHNCRWASDSQLVVVAIPKPGIFCLLFELIFSDLLRIRRPTVLLRFMETRWKTLA